MNGRRRNGTTPNIKSYGRINQHCVQESNFDISSHRFPILRTHNTKTLKCWTLDFSINRGEKGENLSLKTWAKRSDSIICLSTGKSNSFAIKKFQAYKNLAATQFSLIEFTESFKSVSWKPNSRTDCSNKIIIIRT